MQPILFHIPNDGMVAIWLRRLVLAGLLTSCSGAVNSVRTARTSARRLEIDTVREISHPRYDRHQTENVKRGRPTTALPTATVAHLRRRDRNRNRYDGSAEPTATRVPSRRTRASRIGGGTIAIRRNVECRGSTTNPWLRRARRDFQAAAR